MLRAMPYFLIPILVGVFVIPFGIWAAFGFPGDGSHGLWMPVMFACAFGLPGGLLIGTIAGGIALIRNNRKDKAGALKAIDAAIPSCPSDTFEKIK